MSYPPPAGVNFQRLRPYIEAALLEQKSKRVALGLARKLDRYEWRAIAQFDPGTHSFAAVASHQLSEDFRARIQATPIDPARKSNSPMSLSICPIPLRLFMPFEKFQPLLNASNINPRSIHTW